MMVICLVFCGGCLFLGFLHLARLFWRDSLAQNASSGHANPHPWTPSLLSAPAQEEHVASPDGTTYILKPSYGNWP